jgi:Spy/CpxP family protein refolding chaperone
MKISKIALLVFWTAVCIPAFAQGVTSSQKQSTGWQDLGPSGTWWRDPKYVSRLSLTTDQQKRMDDVFQQNRIKLIDLKATLDREEAIMEPMLKGDLLDEIKVTAQIDKVANARAELEKANAKMLLGIRQVLTPEQWTTLNSSKFGGYSDAAGKARLKAKVEAKAVKPKL